MNFEVFRKGWTWARNSLVEEQSVLVHESERHKFSEAAGLLLNFTEKKKLVDPVSGSFDVAVHERRSATDATAMSGTDDLLPLFGRELVAGEEEANIVVENFRRGAR